MNEIGLSLDTVWMLLAAMLVFWMQPGFALCEAGFTRSKNTANILMKNFVDFMFGSLLFFFLGFGFMFGSEGAGFIGMPNWGDLSFYKGDLPVEGFLIFETVFCATSATIVSGAMAERTKFSMYLIYSAVISLFIYPIEGHWTWGGGWLCNDAADSFMMSTFGDVFLEPTVKVILEVAHTGEIGDGRIFVSDVLETYSIRTGEKGDTVLRDKK